MADPNDLYENMPKPSGGDDGNDLYAKIGYKPPEPVGMAQGIADSLAQGGSLGFVDEGVGAGVAAIDAAMQLYRNGKIDGDQLAKVYARARDVTRARHDQFAAEHPAVDLAAQGVGGIASTIATGGAGVAAKGVATAAKAASLGERAVALGRTAAVSAGYGGTAGLGYSTKDDLPGWVSDTATGAAAGAALGVAAPPLARAVVSIVRAPVRVVGQMLSAPSRANAAVLQAIYKDFSHVADPVAHVQAELQKMGPDAALVDLGTPNLMALGNGVVTQPGKGAAMLEALARQRQGKQYSRISDAIKLGLTPGDNRNFLEAHAALNKEMADNAGPMYQIAAKVPIRTNKQLANVLLRSPTMQKVQAAAQRIAADEDGRVLPSIYKTVDGVPTGVQKNLRFAQIDYMKRGLDQLIDGERDPFGKLSGVGRSYVLLKQRFLDAAEASMQDGGKAYRLARQTYAEPKANDLALQMGKKAFGGGAAGDEYAVKDAFDSLGSDAERNFFRIGAAHALVAKVRAMGFTRDAYKAIFNSPASREKLKVIFPDAKSYATFKDAMIAEGKMFESTSELLGGSKTAKVQAAQAATNKPPGVFNVAQHVFNAVRHPIDSAMGAASYIPGKLAPTGTEAARNAIAERLLLQNPQQLLQRLPPPPARMPLPGQDANISMLARILNGNTNPYMQDPQQ